MKKNILILLNLIYFINNSYSQVTLNADGITDTYTLINNVLAPGNDAIETCDECGDHESFGNHITQTFDSEISTNVFQFHMHLSDDTDRCIAANTDRQRNEIKTYDKSPENLLGTENETVIYKWKFKLASDFQGSSKFTHIHQLKSVNDDYSSMPMYTFTVRSSSSGIFQVRYAEFGSQTTVSQIPLSDFLGNWVEVTETITYSNPGVYSLTINKVNNGTNLLTYSNNYNNWRNVVTADGITKDDVFIRPKWGIYRKILDDDNETITNLKDEIVSFANFSIEEISHLSIEDNNASIKHIKMVPNPSKTKITFIGNVHSSFDTISIFDINGKLISKHQNLVDNSLNISDLSNGLYLVVLKKGNTNISQHKLAVN